MQDQGGFTVSFCPSFNSYSSDKVADIAAKVTREDEENEAARNQNDNESSSDDDDNDDFEFVLVRANPDDDSTINGSNEIEYPVFPLFNRDLLPDYGNYTKESQDHHDDVTSAIRLPLKNLFIDDRDHQSSSSSSSEADELEGILPGTYCVWTPPKSPSPARCKKSNSTGSSSKQRWRLRDLLHLRRSSSDGKESFIFYNPDHNNNISKKEEKFEKGKTVRPPAAAPAAVAAARTGKAKEKVSAHEVFYVRNKALKEGDKRRSYLPYRQGLVGFFANVNGTGKTFHPF